MYLLCIQVLVLQLVPDIIFFPDFPGSSVGKTWVQSLGWENLLETEMAAL